jgi:hypothetical protein
MTGNVPLTPPLSRKGRRSTGFGYKIFPSPSTGEGGVGVTRLFAIMGLK